MSISDSIIGDNKFTAGIVFLHGSGDTGQGFHSWISDTHKTFFQELADKGFLFAFPSATPRKYSLFGGEVANVWHDRTELALNCTEDTAGVLEAVSVVDQQIDGLVEAGVPVEHCFVLGMSMGGHVALQSLCHSRHRRLIAGVVALSCFLSTASPSWALLQQPVLTESAAESAESVPAVVRVPPLCLMHGQADSMVPCKWGEVTSDRLKEIGLTTVEFTSVPKLGHDMAQSELQHVLDWLENICVTKR